MTSPVKLSRIHHVAYRCRDAKETVDWYHRVLGMEYTTAFAEDHVPSTGAYDPYMHIFLDAGGGAVGEAQQAGGFVDEVLGAHRVVPSQSIRHAT